MKLFFSPIFVGILAFLGFTHCQEELARGTANKAAKCGETYELKPGKPVTIKSKAGECSWGILGTDKCQPEISCSGVKVTCPDETLTISDGIGGEKAVCAEADSKQPRRASAKGRDIYIDSKLNKGAFTCKAECSKGGAEELAIVGEVKKTEFGCVCGLQNKQDRIIGGEDATKREFPWQVAIVLPGTRKPMCGGAMINSRYVLTAAHCFVLSKIKPKHIEVLIHAYLLDFLQTRTDASEAVALGEEGSMQARGHEMAQVTDEQEGTIRFKVLEIINHPLFSTEFDYDAALLRIDGKIDLKDANAPTPICLPPPGSYKETFVDKVPTVVGWGLGAENAGATTRLLQKLDVPVIEMAKCHQMMPDMLTDRMLCAGFKMGVKDACTGDSGGPLSLKQNDQFTQIGVVSWGEGCARQDRPGLYARVTEFVPWITRHANTPGTVWCRESKS